MGYFDALLRYFEFSGRTTRGQYWMFQLALIVLSVGAAIGDYAMTGHSFDEGRLGLLVAFVSIFHIVPSITVTVRRLHDIGKSGWWFLLGFVPFGALWILVWTCFGSEQGANAYGDDPHQQAPRGPSPPRGRAAAADGAAQDMLARMAARRSSVSAAS